MSEVERRQLSRQPPLFDGQAATTDPIGALDAMIAELERARADAQKARDRSKPRDREALAAALAAVESRIAEARLRRNDLAERLSAKEQLERLAVEANALTLEARS